MHTDDLAARGRTPEELQSDLQAELLARNVFRLCFFGVALFCFGCLYFATY